MKQRELLALEWKEVDTPYWEARGVDYVTLTTAVIPDRGLTGIGIDPGRNFGVAFVEGDTLGVLHGTMPKESDIWRYGIEAFHMIQNIMGKYHAFSAAVEGPSFRAKYGQAALESIRFGFALGLIELGASVDIVPPATIRAEVLGHGNNRAGEFWPELNDNAADAVAAAFYASGVRREGEPKKWPPPKTS